MPLDRRASAADATTPPGDAIWSPAPTAPRQLALLASTSTIALRPRRSIRLQTIHAGEIWNHCAMPVPCTQPRIHAHEYACLPVRRQSDDAGS